MKKAQCNILTYLVEVKDLAPFDYKSQCNITNQDGMVFNSSYQPTTQIRKGPWGTKHLSTAHRYKHSSIDA